MRARSTRRSVGTRTGASSDLTGRRDRRPGRRDALKRLTGRYAASMPTRDARSREADRHRLVVRTVERLDA
jgi:hypothetical protein